MKLDYGKQAVGLRLRATRFALGYGEGEQTLFAENAGLTQSQISNYETAVRLPKPDEAHKLCDTYSLTFDWIYRGDPSGLGEHLRKKLIKAKRTWMLKAVDEPIARPKNHLKVVHSD